jgi:hypothetical protein
VPQYSGGLFDSNGPAQFATSLASVSKALQDIVTSLTTMGATSTQVLGNIQTQLKGITGASSSKGSPATPGGAAQTSWQPSGQFPNGGVGGQQGNVTANGGSSNAPASYAPMGSSTSNGGQPSGGSSGSGDGGFISQTGQIPNGGWQGDGAGGRSMLSRAGESFPAALAGSAQSYFANNLDGQLQMDMSGGFLARQQGQFSPNAANSMAASAGSGQFFTSNTDRANATYMQSASLPNMSQAQISSSTKGLMMLDPGMTNTQATGVLANMFSNPQTTKTMNMYGLTPIMNGKDMGTNALFEKIWQANFPRTHNTTDFKALWDNGEGANVQQEVGGDADTAQAFYNWAIAKMGAETSMANNPMMSGSQLKKMQAIVKDPLSTAALSGTSLSTNPAMNETRRKTTASNVAAATAGGAATAAETMDNAAATFSSGVDKLLRGLGIGGIAGAAGGFLSGIPGASMIGGLFGGGSKGGGGGGGVGGIVKDVGLGILGKKLLGRMGARSAAKDAAEKATENAAKKATGDEAAEAGAEAGADTAAEVGGGGFLAGIGESLAGLGTAIVGSAAVPLVAGAAVVAGTTIAGATLANSSLTQENSRGSLGAQLNLSNLSQISNAVGYTSALTSNASTTVSSNAAIPTGQHKTLIDQALQLANQPVNSANEAAVNTIVSHESSWKANAINKTDSNAAAGHPSQGLMQTIPSTFATYAISGYNSNIDDPLSNLIAGIRYAVHTYKSLQQVPGVEAVNAGQPYVGYERGTMDVATTGPAVLHKGERVIPAAENTPFSFYNSPANNGSGGGSITITFEAGSIVFNGTSMSTTAEAQSAGKDFLSAIVENKELLRGIRGR